MRKPLRSTLAAFAATALVLAACGDDDGGDDGMTDPTTEAPADGAEPADGADTDGMDDGVDGMDADGMDDGADGMDADGVDDGGTDDGADGMDEQALEEELDELADELDEAAPAEACGLLDAEAIEAATGLSVGDGESPAESVCGWESEDGAVALTVIDAAAVGEDAEAEMATITDQDPAAEEVDGIGDEAYMTAFGLVVRDGDILVTVLVEGGDGGEEELAGQVLDQL